ADLKQILEIQLQRVRSRLAERHIDIQLTPEAATHLAREGYDPVYGARPLKRAIQKELETPIGRRLLAGEIHDGQQSDRRLEEWGVYFLDQRSRARGNRRC